MSVQFFPKLSQNYIEILEDDEYYDLTIKVGKDPDVKIFRAHMIILCYRSPFLRRTLASNKKNNDGGLTHIKLPDILPEIFQIILKVSLDENSGALGAAVVTAYSRPSVQSASDCMLSMSSRCSPVS